MKEFRWAVQSFKTTKASMILPSFTKLYPLPEQRDILDQFNRQSQTYHKICTTQHSYKAYDIPKGFTLDYCSTLVIKPCSYFMFMTFVYLFQLLGFKLIIS